MRTQRNPRIKKAKDNARLRKISCNSSDKASRKNAPKIKAMANRSVRRADKIKLVVNSEFLEESANTLAHEHRRKGKHWGSYSAAEARAFRDKERAFLDETAGHPLIDPFSGRPLKGRQRSRCMPSSKD